MSNSCRAWFPISAGLLTREHHGRLGPAWMVFLYLVHQQRRPHEGENDSGICLKGEPMTYEQMSRDLGNIPARTIEKHIGILECQKYIRSEYVRGEGKRYWIRNPLRWSLLGSPKVADSNCLESSDLGSTAPQTGGVVLPNVEERNKETRTNARTNPKTKPIKLPPLVSRFPDWLPLDAWEGFVEMRSKIRAPLTEKAADLIVAKLEKLRAEGHDTRQVLEESIQNSWRGVWPAKGSQNGLNKAEQRQADNLRAAEEAKRQLGLVN